MAIGQQPAFAGCEFCRCAPYARYSFDTFKGDSIIDSSGNGFWGSKTKTTLSSGRIGNALHFRNLDSSTASIHDAAALNMDNAEFSVAAWAYFDSLAPHLYLLSKGPVGACCASNGYPGYLLGVYNYRLAFRIEDEATGINSVHAAATAAPPCSVWTHVAGVRRGGHTFLYLDGRLVDSASIPSPETYSINNNYPVSLGYRLNGRIDEVQVYNRALTSQEVTGLFNEEIPRASVFRPSVAGSFSPKIFFGDGRIRIKIAYPANTDLHVDVYNVAGRKILEWNRPEVSSGLYNIQLPHGIPEGCYLARVELAGATTVSRLMAFK